MWSSLPVWALLSTTLFYSTTAQYGPVVYQPDPWSRPPQGPSVHGSGQPRQVEVYPPPYVDPYQPAYPPNPCPQMFKYAVNSSSGVPYGEAIVQPPQGSQDFELEVNMTVNAAVNQDDGLKLSVLSGQNDILSGREIRYGVRFPVSVWGEVPWLTQLRFNGAVICSGSGPRLEEGKVQSAMWAKSTITTRPSGTYRPSGPYPPGVDINYVRPGEYPGTYPSQVGTYPSQVGTYPGQQGTYPAQQGPNPSQPGVYPGEGVFVQNLGRSNSDQGGAYQRQGGYSGSVAENHGDSQAEEGSASQPQQ